MPELPWSMFSIIRIRFFDRTCFQFDHNMPGAEMDVLIRIYTVSGRLIKTIEQTMITDGAIRQDDCIEWDGTDDFGDKIGKGVYVYKVLTRVRNSGSDDLKGESAFEKLVILK
jgi:flagellar hook assembly protein FlgD